MNRTKRTRPRRLLSLLLAWLLCLSCAQPAFAANETAATVQMMKTEGTVSVTNSSGKSVSQRDKMRLYNGYHVGTEEASYAWLNLDSAKLSKLDAVSEMELRKNGKKLELLLNSGNLYFNVTEPLEEEETLNIRTSTMVVGIRGTCGWVQVIDRWNTEVYLLEGQVECRVSDPVTGEIKSTVLTGGETADFVVYPQDRPGDKCDIIRDRFTEDDIPGFVLVELVEDVDLCDEIYEDSGLDILGRLPLTGGGDPSGKLPSGDAATPEVIAEAERRLEEDEEETARKLEDIREQEDGQERNISKDPVWEDEQDKQGGQTSGGTPPAVSVTPPVTPPVTVTDLTMKITDDEAQAALNGANTVNVLPSAEPTENTLEVDSGLNIQPGKTLTLQPGINVHVLEDQPLQVDGTLDVVRGNVGNFGNLTVTSSNTLHVGGSLYNGDVINQGGQITVTATGRVVVDGTFYNYGGTLNLMRGATVKAKEFGLTPMPDGWRVSDTPDAEGYYTLVPETAVTASGMAGDNVFWSYTEATKTLRIWGSGPMTDFSYDYGTDETDVPWYAYVGEIETLTIEDEVEHIGDYALHMCTALKNVSLPDSLTSIGSHAFYGCSGLTSITIPDGVTSIGDSAFYDCSGLTNIDLSAGLTSIGNGAFYFCDGLTEINIPDGVTSIGSFAFFGCSGLTSITIPDSVTSIGNNAFEGCDRLTRINIPAGVTSIEENTFLGCSSLASITISNGVTSIGDYAFSGCSGLADVYYGGTRTQWNAIRIGDNNDDLLNATLHCIDDGEEPDSTPDPGDVDWEYDEATLTLIIRGNGEMDNYLPANNASPWSEYADEAKAVEIYGVTTIGSWTLYDFTNVETVTIPDNVTSIGSYAFYSCRKLTSITIPDSVTSIGGSAFTFCSSLTDITIPAGVTSIEGATFSGCSGLTSITIPDSVTSIGDTAFSDCSNLTSITIPAGVTSIGSYTFSNCSGLTEINIPDGVTSIGDSAFGSCSSLTNIRIPDSVISIGNSAFARCSSLAEANLPVGVTSIGEYMFRGCSNLTEITIPDHVTSINRFAFMDCVGLANITIPNGVTNIGYNAFGGCSGLTSLVLPESLVSIGGGAFSACTSLIRIAIPDGVTSIDSGAFNNCIRLTEIDLPAGVTNIEGSTFSGCSSLTSITIPDGVTSIGSYAFNNCSVLTSVTIPASVTSIGDGAFANCGLTEVNYGGTQAQWNAITIETGNDPLTSATIHCTDGDINSSTQTASLVNNAPAPVYEDVSPDAWYAEAVAYCREHGLMNGTSAARFSPDDTLTRAMMVTVLHRMAGEPAAAAAASFCDVEAGQWYTEAVSWASGNGIVLGYGNGLFGTDDPVTHEQVALLLQRRSGDADVHVYGEDEPQAPATRAEIAATLMDYVKAHPNMLTAVSAMNVMCEPSSVLAMEDGSLLVTDTYNKVIWRVTGGVSEIYAGSDTVEDLYGRPVGGYNDAPLAESYFKTPWAIAPFLEGWAVSDTENGAVRLISSEITQTVNGRTKEKLTVSDLGVVFDYPTGLAADEDGNLYVSDTHQSAIRKITPDGEVTTFAKNLSEPMGLCWKDGALYAAETGANRIVKIVDGVVTVIAGSGEDGLKDGPAAQAAFSGPKGVVVGDDGTVYVADTANSAVRQIKDGQVTTLAVRDVTDLDAFSPIFPVGLLVRGNTLYICDQFSRKLLALQLG